MNPKSFHLPIDATNLLKFVACLMVASSHYFTYRILGLENTQYAMQSGGGIYLICKTLMSLGGAVGNAVFFFLSGYGLMQSDSRKHLGFPAFVKRRLSKVYFPVLLITAIWLPISIYFQHYHYSGPLHLLKTFFWGFDDGVLWFVKALFLMYISFYLFTLLREKNTTLAHLVMAVLTTGACIYCYKFVGPWSYTYVPAFYIGMLCSLNKENVEKGIFLPWAAIAAVMLVASYMTGGMAKFYHSVIDYGVIAAIIVLFTYGRKCKEIRFPAILGAISFDVYLIHNKVIYILTDQMDFLPCWLWLAVTFAIVPLFYSLRTKMNFYHANPARLHLKKEE